MNNTKRNLTCLAAMAILLMSHGCASLKKSTGPEQSGDGLNVVVDDSAAAQHQKLAKANTAGIEDLILEFENANIYFDFDKFSLSPEARKTLAAKRDLLADHTDLAVEIQGNCDERGTLEYNLALGERRAKAAKDFLVSGGIAAERIATISYGEEKPLDPGHEEKAWAKNRNARFVITNK
jgi:peptidoglycan-associated lipoprotein